MQVVVVRDAESNRTNARQGKHVAVFESNGLIDLQVADLAGSEHVGGGKWNVEEEKKVVVAWARALATRS